ISGVVDTNTAGQYTRTYTITDPSGNSNQANRIVLVGFPNAITASASNLVNQSVTMTGTVNPRGADTAAWFEWGRSIAYRDGQAPVSVGTTPGNLPVSSVLSGFDPGVLYHWRLVASNAAGISRGADQIFWLPALRLNGAALATNQCHVTYTNP